MKITIAILILISNVCIAQDKERTYPQYWENFEYSIDKHSATIQSKKIDLPLTYIEKLYGFKRDSLYNIAINEREKEYEYIIYNNYKVSCITSYEWIEGQRPNGDVISQASMNISFQRKNKKEEVFSEEFDSLLNYNDSLRYLLHSKLRKKHEAYVLKKCGLNFNISQILANVNKVVLYRITDNRTLKKVLFKDTLITTEFEFVRTLSNVEKNQVLSVLGKDSEFMTPFRSLCFVAFDNLYLSDKNNSYIGLIRLVKENCPGYSFDLKINNELFYHDSSVFYKGLDIIYPVITK